MNMYRLLAVFVIFGCEAKPRRHYVEGPRHQYHAVIDRIRDVAVNEEFDVRAILKDSDGDRLDERITARVWLRGGSSDADLRGDVIERTSNGRVRFDDLRIDHEGRNYRIELTFRVDGDEFSNESNRFDVIDDDDYDDDDNGNGISVGGSLFRIEMNGMPDVVTAGRALPDLVFKVKVFGGSGTGSKVTLKVEDNHGELLEGALMVWRGASLKAKVRDSKAVFTEAFFTTALDADAKIVAKTLSFVESKEFDLPRVQPAALAVDIDRISATEEGTEFTGVVRWENTLCANCRIVSYLISNDNIRDAAIVTTDSTGNFTAKIASWKCAKGVAYQGAIKVTQMNENYYARISSTCN